MSAAHTLHWKWMKKEPTLRILIGEQRQILKEKANFRFWFSDWQVTGSKVKHYPERSFGPILFTQFTISNNLLKLTAQMPPLGESDSKQVTLEIKNNNQWEAVSTASIDKPSQTATFKHKLEPGYSATSYRVHYHIRGKRGLF